MFLYYMIFVFCGNLKEIIREIIFINREIISFFLYHADDHRIGVAAIISRETVYVHLLIVDIYDTARYIA